MAESNNENKNLIEIKELENKLAEKKAELEGGLAIESKEVETTKENAQEKQSQVIIMKPSGAVITDEEKKDLEEIKKDISKIRNLDVVRQVKVLVTLAFEKGLSHSIKVARSLDDEYLLDVLHDELTGELHDELIKKGKLKDI